MWVEIVGLPGVGKTTFVRSNSPFLSNYFELLESRKPSILRLLFCKALYFVYFWKRIGDIRFEKKMAYRAAFRYLKNDRHILFYDSGIIQVLFENLIESKGENFASKYELVKKLKLPDVVLYITDDIDAVVEREFTRPKRRFSFSREELKKRYIAIEKDLLSMLNGCVDQVILIDSSKHSKDEVRIHVETILQRFM